VFVTHLHPDHHGLERWLGALGAEIVSLGDPSTGRHPDEWQANAEGYRSWVLESGFPADELDRWGEAVSGASEPPPRALVPDETAVRLGGRSLEVIATPGHSPRMACLFDRAGRVFFSSDHVLEEITPHVGRFSAHENDPLGDYLRSLRRVRDLDAMLVLPGHGPPLSRPLATRVDEILEHHRLRTEEVRQALSLGACTGWEVASSVSWLGRTNGWDDLRGGGRFMALVETLAHMRRLELEAGA
jgi:glyoxylase-like metal-dependent hydrolase (beta-lactamase superfamily II)